MPAIVKMVTRSIEKSVHSIETSVVAEMEILAGWKQTEAGRSIHSTITAFSYY